MWGNIGQTREDMVWMSKGKALRIEPGTMPPGLDSAGRLSVHQLSRRTGE